VLFQGGDIEEQKVNEQGIAVAEEQKGNEPGIAVAVASAGQSEE
jgi:hypothetical protein